MSSVTPIKPSFVFGYWRPWAEDADVFASYLDYTKDVSLVKYGADTVGKYILQASQEHVQAIDKVSQSIGISFRTLSTQLSEIDDDLPPLNGTASRERIWGWSKPREATNATRKEGTG